MRRILLLRIRNASVPADILNKSHIRTSPLLLGISSSHRELFVLFLALRKEDLIHQRKKGAKGLKKICPRFSRSHGSCLDPVWNPSIGTIISNRVPFLYSPVSLIIIPVLARIFCTRKRPSVFSFPDLHSKR
jgi:hypothetical protein